MLSFSNNLSIVGIAAAVGLAATSVVSAQNVEPGSKAPTKPLAVGNPIIENFTFGTAHDVIQLLVKSPNGQLIINTRDCCILGDKWIVRAYCLQNNAVTDVRGKGNGSAANTGFVTIYKNGVQPIDCIVELRYGQGVSVFPAGMSARFSGGGLNITTTRLSSTMVKPLPSQ